MDYKTTLNLPHTEFPMKANLAQREPDMVARWQRDQCYEAMLEARTGKPPFILHDGPPYANGSIHFGHILNKVLKDIVVKSRAMAGHYTPYLPGWDCHGLPIELAVEKELVKQGAATDPVSVRKACRTYAEQYVALQREEFRRLGCFGLWDTPYTTMDFGYQATIARQFAAAVKRGAVYSGKKPVHWCASCRTALAEAEVEHEEKRSPSIYVKFALTDDDTLRSHLGIGSAPLCVVIWTTTPWTIPANLGIALHPDLAYVAVEVGDEVWILAEGRLAPVMEELEIEDYRVCGAVDPKALDRKVARHPLIARDSLLMLGTHVTLESGSGCVHTAPGHGHDDFALGQRYGLPPLAPLDDGGKFTEEVGLPWLTGLFVKKADPLIIDKLREVGALIAATDITHQYPHCWRCKRPILFRVTEQWFISMDTSQLRARALAAIDTVHWVPEWGQSRIRGMMESRPDWCISRQRVWGVPIIAVRCESCETRSTSPALIEHVADRIAEEGADCWYERPLEELLPPGFQCPQCQTDTVLTRENDILDVWFDSGSSFAAALERQLGCPAPADLYLEGSDQHRGWFHTSLLVGLETRDVVPYKTVLTHGFVVDGAGKKYSKSAKNYDPPEKVIGQHGAEILRLWVSAEDYSHDIRVSSEIIKRLTEAYRKIRNTWRFLLGNLHDFDPETHLIDVASRDELDQWILHAMQGLIARCRGAYDAYEFHHVAQAVTAFCSVDLSARYLDICKDRLYCEQTNGHKRRAVQSTMWEVGEALTRLMAPILSFTAEEVWDFFPGGGSAQGSIFLAALPAAEGPWTNDALAKRWERFWPLREVATRALEEARQAKVIGNALGAQITIETDDDTRAFLESFGTRLADLFIVSDLQFGTVSGDHVAHQDTGDACAVSVHSAPGKKCARCWKWSTSVGTASAHPEACARCVTVVSS